MARRYFCRGNEAAPRKLGGGGKKLRSTYARAASGHPVVQPLPTMNYPLTSTNDGRLCACRCLLFA